VSCAEGDAGFVYDGIAQVEVRELALEAIPPTRTKVMLNLANPTAAFRWWRLPADGVGLARIEFIVNNLVKIHPMALVRFDAVKDGAARREIRALTRGWADRTAYFVDTLADRRHRLDLGEPGQLHPRQGTRRAGGGGPRARRLSGWPVHSPVSIRPGGAEASALSAASRPSRSPCSRSTRLSTAAPATKRTMIACFITDPAR
jgi:hypothetical protein